MSAIYSPPTRPHKLRKEKRTIELKAGGVGESDERGVWFQCWNCGFKCKVDRDQLDDGNARSGATYQDYPIQAINGVLSGVQVEGMPVLRTPNMSFVSLSLSSDGTPQNVDHRYQVSGTGCPLCHTKNWK